METCDNCGLRIGIGIGAGQCESSIMSDGDETPYAHRVALDCERRAKERALAEVASLTAALTAATKPRWVSGSFGQRWLVAGVQAEAQIEYRGVDGDNAWLWVSGHSQGFAGTLDAAKKAAEKACGVEVENG